MTNRSAHATIKGYFYQFDHTIVRLLEATEPGSSVVVEGIEDIDLDDGDDSAFVQCKYYEGTEYNHSVIKDALIQMLRHFHAAGCPAQKLRYMVYGHYKGGQQKLSAGFDLDFLKKHFLTYEQKKTTHEVHAELGVSDIQLAAFHSLLDIDLHAPSYEDQQKKVMKLLASRIPGCNADDAEVFYYPNAINVVQKLATEANVTKREITKAAFVSAVNRKDTVFSLWLRQKFGDDYYAKLIKRKYFKFASTKVPAAARIFIIDMTNEFDLLKAVSLLGKIGRSFSHVEHVRTPPDDRFCPYILLRGLTPQNLISLKGSLMGQGVKFVDGYPFHGSAFHAALIAAAPTKENLIRLKFIPAAEQLAPVVSAISGSVIELFDFFKAAPLEAKYAPPGVPHHTIKVGSTYFIGEAI